MLWYRVSSFRWAFSTPELEEKDVLRATASRVYFHGGRFENKTSDYHRWFETYIEAFKFVVNTLQDRAKRLDKEAQDTRDRLNKFRRSHWPVQNKRRGLK